jgi:hypothetical protein
MAIRNPADYVEKEDTRGTPLALGWHTLQIDAVKIVSTNYGRKVELAVRSVTPATAGQTMQSSGTRYGIDHDIFLGLLHAAQTPPIDDDNEAQIIAELTGRCFNAACRMQKDSDKYRELGWPKRPSAEDLASPHIRPRNATATPKPATHLHPPHYVYDDIPF